MGESDRLITILTSDLGLIRAFAPNALKFKSKNLSSTQLMSYSRLVIYKSRDTYKINDAKTIELFYNLRSDLMALSLASYICELAIALSPQDEKADDFLKIVLNCLYFLSEKKQPYNIIKAIAELKICQYAGYMPNIAACCKCGKSNVENANLDALNGIIYCDDCKSSGDCKPLNYKLLNIPSGVLAAMRHILYGNVKNIFSFILNENSAKILTDITEKFVTAQTERRFKTLDFYNSLSEEQ